VPHSLLGYVGVVIIYLPQIIQLADGYNQPINIRLLKHDKIQANNIKKKELE